MSYLLSPYAGAVGLQCFRVCSLSQIPALKVLGGLGAEELFGEVKEYAIQKTMMACLTASLAFPVKLLWMMERFCISGEG